MIRQYQIYNQTYKDKVISFRIKKNEKPIRFFAIKEMKNYLAKPDGNVNFGLVTHVVPLNNTKKKNKNNLWKEVYKMSNIENKNVSKDVI